MNTRTTHTAPDGTISVLVPPEAFAVTVSHAGQARTTWFPLSMIDDTPALETHAPREIRRMWIDLQSTET